MAGGEPVRKRLYSLKEAAVYMGISVWSLRRLIWNGLLPSVRGQGWRRVLVDVGDMDGYIDQHKVVEPPLEWAKKRKEGAYGDAV
jgi:excisionase family DNA binding protein